jgi:FdhD protein
MINKIFKTVTVTRVNEDRVTTRERIIKETALEIRVNGEHLTTAMFLATLEKEFVVGNLFTQGIIESAGDIKELTLKNNIAEVVVARKKTGHALKKIDSGLKVNPEDIINCVRSILKSEVFAETEAVHSAGLFLEGKETICIAEDLGRHNALDKVIGYGLLHNVDFSRTLAASTGRQPSEMITKCQRAGIPIITTKGVPTTRGVKMAVEAGITIAGLVRGQTMVVYSHLERITGYDEK